MAFRATIKPQDETSSCWGQGWPQRCYQFNQFSMDSRIELIDSSAFNTELID